MSRARAFLGFELRAGRRPFRPPRPARPAAHGLPLTALPHTAPAPSQSAVPFAADPVRTPAHSTLHASFNLQTVMSLSSRLLRPLLLHLSRPFTASRALALFVACLHTLPPSPGPTWFADRTGGRAVRGKHQVQGLSLLVSTGFPGR